MLFFVAYLPEGKSFLARALVGFSRSSHNSGPSPDAVRPQAVSRWPAKTFLHVITILAMVVQLGVVAYHHHSHEELGEHSALAWSVGEVERHRDAHAGHDHHHDHGIVEGHHDGNHHDPIEGDHQDCDLCLFKTNVSSALLAHASAGLWNAAPVSKLRFAKRDRFYRDVSSQRYQARAPPAGLLIS